MLLEGTDIRALLQQVRDSYGPEARIVHAERIRSGGMGGFFAKQRYEVTVEVDADAATTASASAIARSIHEELASAHDVYRHFNLECSSSSIARPTGSPALPQWLGRMRRNELTLGANSGATCGK